MRKVKIGTYYFLSSKARKNKSVYALGYLKSRYHEDFDFMREYPDVVYSLDDTEKSNGIALKDYFVNYVY